MTLRRWCGLTALVLLPLSSGCELEQITLVDSEDVVVAEVYVEVVPDAGQNRITAFLHRTLATQVPYSRPVPGATVIVQRSDGLSLEMGEASQETCVSAWPVDGAGSCYWVAPELASRIQPGDSLTLEITLADGGHLSSATVVPGGFALVTPSSPSCLVTPDKQLTVRWTRSAGAWAYVNETLISGLPAALATRGISYDEDPLYLLGVSISNSDTTIAFPGEFGVFDRFSLDQPVSLALQKGLPEGTSGQVTITAADRNYVNWVRGGNFNPSGPVRLPSIRGDGTGVFASSISRGFLAYAAPPGAMQGVPSCAGS